MYEYLNYYHDRESESANDLRLTVLENFFENYHIKDPANMYMWLWEGEFGYSSYRQHDDLLDNLT